MRTITMGLVVLVGSAAAAEGVIQGVVVNGSRQNTPASDVDVVLRVPFDGEFVVAAQTTTNADGQFRFAPLPLDGPGPYLPGANLADVHFPGPRISLDARQPHASITLTVFEPNAETNPLVIEDHRIVVEAEPGALRVRETMLIDNPSSTCFVGSPRHEGGGPVTLQLGIAEDFVRITFDKEGFGRQFHLINGRLVTGIPWPPGKRELGFTYVIPNQKGNRVWQRQVDLPTSQVQVMTRGSDPDQIACSLPSVASHSRGEAHFSSNGQMLAAGDVIQLELDRLPVPAIVSARWAALLVLFVLVACVTVVSRRRRTESKRHVAPKIQRERHRFKSIPSRAS